MTFTYEIEENNNLVFLDVLVTREEKFCTSLYRKPTFSGLFPISKVLCPFLIRKDSFILFFTEHLFHFESY